MIIQKKFLLLRLCVLVLILCFVSWQLFSHSLGNKFFPAVHGICPFGAVESLLFYIRDNGMTLHKVYSGAMGLFFVTVILTIFFRRAFCGLICPLGTLQELSHKLGGFILKGRSFHFPPLIDRPLRYLKYLILVLAVAMAWLTGTLWFQIIDPWAAYGHILKPDELFTLYFTGFLVLCISLVASVFTDRFFCKYACPMGALNSLLGLLSPFRVTRNTETCTNCNLCTRVCPVNIEVASKKVVQSPECINCEVCTASCPEKDTLQTKFLRTKCTPVVSLLLVVLFFFTGIYGFQLMGFDRYSGKTPMRLHELAKSQGLSPSEYKEKLGLPKGFSNRAHIRDVEYNIPFEKMAELNGISVVDLKERLDITDVQTDSDSLWGEVYGEVRLEVIASMSRASVEEYKAFYGLEDAVHKDTRWKEIRETVEDKIDKQAAASGCGNH